MVEGNKVEENDTCLWDERERERERDASTQEGSKLRKYLG